MSVYIVVYSCLSTFDSIYPARDKRSVHLACSFEIAAPRLIDRPSSAHPVKICDFEHKVTAERRSVKLFALILAFRAFPRRRNTLITLAVSLHLHPLFPPPRFTLSPSSGSSLTRTHTRTHIHTCTFYLSHRYTHHFPYFLRLPFRLLFLSINEEEYAKYSLGEKYCCVKKK